ncbi:MAG: DNA-processing protein DprA [Gemmatimonadales bacterium]|nr:DNA-processing protein DprA [Gemmatimonadales bacterium]
MIARPPATRPPLTGEARLAWLALAQVPGVGARRFEALLAAFGSAEAALAAPPAAVAAVRGIGTACAAAIARARPEAARTMLEAFARAGATVLLPDDDTYPASLRTIDEPPLFLAALGRLDLLERRAVAVVGSRDHSAYGATCASMVTAAAAAAGLVVVSGMARGIDAIVHEAALATGTVGVLGNGIDVVYPAANRRLHERVARDGLLLSEFPPGERPAAHTFPRRNRLVSGLAEAIVIVEAAAQSGALITARIAADQGREVLAVPGEITRRTAAGCNRLLAEGARPYLEPRDLYDALPGLVVPEAAVAAAESPSGGEAALPPLVAPPHASEPARRVALAFDRAVADPDHLSGRTGLAVPALLGALLELELAGLVRPTGTGTFARAW